MNKEAKRFRDFKDYASFRSGGYTIKEILRELRMDSQKELNALMNDEYLNSAYRREMQAMIVKFSWHWKFYKSRGQGQRYADCLLNLRKIIDSMLKDCGHEQD